MAATEAAPRKHTKARCASTLCWSSYCASTLLWQTNESAGSKNNEHQQFEYREHLNLKTLQQLVTNPATSFDLANQTTRSKSPLLTQAEKDQKPENCCPGLTNVHVQLPSRRIWCPQRRAAPYRHHLEHHLWAESAGFKVRDIFFVNFVVESIISAGLVLPTINTCYLRDLMATLPKNKRHRCSASLLPQLIQSHRCRIANLQSWRHDCSRQTHMNEGDHPRSERGGRRARAT